MKPSLIPDELKGKDLFKFVVENESLILHAKKSSVKKADAILSPIFQIDDKGRVISNKGVIEPISPSATQLKLDVVINTTNYFDSHMDVHIPGLWNKSISDNRKNGFYLLEEHSRSFRGVIGEKLAATATKVSWQELGYNYPGITEALVFSGIIEKIRNPFMFDQYAKGYVRQHSVGMRYVKLVTCINDDDFPVQKENWDKYIPFVVNAEDAEAHGMFWAVTEAKINEGSAVLFGSNSITPTTGIQEVKNTVEQPSNDTAEQPFDFIEAIKSTTFFN